MTDFAHTLQLKLDELAKNIESGYVEVGFLGSMIHPDTGENYAKIAFWNEFGTISSGKPVSFMAGNEHIVMAHKGMPARPFFRTMISKEKGSWADKIAKGLKHTDFNTDKTLGMLGLDIQGALQESIQNWTEPANAPLTIKKKGFNKPLIDTGNMWKKAIEIATHKGLAK